MRGKPIRGELSTADADPALEIVLYEAGSLTVITLLSDEFLEIESVHVVSVAGGDVYVFIGADNTVGAGEIVIRGTVAANGRLFAAFSPEAVSMGDGLLPWLFAPVGQTDVQFTGRIVKA